MFCFEIADIVLELAYNSETSKEFLQRIGDKIRPNINIFNIFDSEWLENFKRRLSDFTNYVFSVSQFGKELSVCLEARQQNVLSENDFKSKICCAVQNINNSSNDLGNSSPLGAILTGTDSCDLILKEIMPKSSVKTEDKGSAISKSVIVFVHLA